MFIRDFGNKFFSSSLNIHSQQTSYLPTVLSSINTGMDIPTGNISDNYDKVRGKTSLPKIQFYRESSIFSTKSSIAYYEKIKLNNTMNENVDMDNNSSTLSYETSLEKTIRVSMVANPNNNMINKCIIIEHPISNSPCAPVKYPNSVSSYSNDTVINIQLPYNPNAPMEPDLWNSNFHPISLHDSIKYLALDLKNIKDSLNFMAKYITNKQVDLAKSNDLENFNSIGKAI